MNHFVTIRPLPGEQAPPILPAPPEAKVAFRLAVSDPAPVFLPAPLFADRADYTWFHTHAWNHMAPKIGLTRDQSFIRRDYDKFVVLTRYGEGVIFDAEGASNSPGFLNNIETLPEGLRRAGDHFVADTEMLARAPRLPGAWLIFYNGNLQNYFHWLVEGMLALHVLDGETPLARRTVLPAHLPPEGRFDHVGIMQLLGHGHLEVARIGAPFVRCEEVVHLEQGGIHEYPSHHLQHFRDKMAARFGGGASQNRICILRQHLRSVINQDELDRVLGPMGFRNYRMEDMSAEEQIRLFANASAVVSPHGAGLSNLVFAPAGCKVIELMPRCEMRPFFSQIGAKLGQVYGMMPCDHDAEFNGRLTVDIGKFRRLFDMVSAVN